jgi:hypothetical protein
MERIQRANSGAPGEIGPGGEWESQAVNGRSPGGWKRYEAKKRERWINGRGKATVERDPSDERRGRREGVERENRRVYTDTVPKRKKFLEGEISQSF